MALYTVRAPDGRVLGRRADGTLAVTGLGQTGLADLVAYALGADGDCLLEAPGLTIRLDGAARAKPVLALRATGTRFTLEPLEGPPPECLLARLPQGLALDQDGLAAIIRGGDAALLPVADAMLDFLDAAQGRDAWTAHPRAAAQDAFHPLLRAHGHLSLQPFASFTADLLRPEIERHGWSIGAHTYGRPLLMEVGRGKLSIGRFCSMADPTIILGNHGTRSATSYPFLDMWTEWPGTTVDLSDHTARDVRIGNDVWIGVGAIILPGAVIGDGAIVGAGAVVRGAMPPYGICTGNPGRIERFRCDDASIARFLRIKWWDWPDGMIDRYIPLLLARDPGPFLDAAESELGLAALSQ